MQSHRSVTLVSFAVLTFAGSALAGCAAKVTTSEPTASAGQAESSHCPPDVPAALAVPAGNRVAFHLDGIGVQIYACSAVGAGYGWVFQAPAANLYDDHGTLEGTHYKGPTWQADDGSIVVGSKLAAYTPDPTSIPWLLLQAVSHSGDGSMDNVTYVQRLDTVGGLAPATGCDAPSVGAVANVDYTATYYFYEATEGEGDPGDCSE